MRVLPGSFHPSLRLEHLFATLQTWQNDSSFQAPSPCRVPSPAMPVYYGFFREIIIAVGSLSSQLSTHDAERY